MITIDLCRLSVLQSNEYQVTNVFRNNLHSSVNRQQCRSASSSQSVVAQPILYIIQSKVRNTIIPDADLQWYNYDVCGFQNAIAIFVALRSDSVSSLTYCTPGFESFASVLCFTFEWVRTFAVNSDCDFALVHIAAQPCQ